VISAIPILLKILEVVLDLIPRHFFKKFFEILNALHIIAIWHYIVIIASIGFALLAIYIIQKKIFNKRRLQIKRLTKGLCYHCGKKLPPGVDICPYCGTNQQKNCPSCNHLTFVAGEFCTSCGKEVQ
jgi:RNA polymerase subunit RPABC4/transcription elongation factor Spt4